MDLIHYYDAQVAVLGSLLIEPDKLSGEIMHRVRPEDFGDAPLRNIFRAAKELYLANAPLDAVTVVERAGKGYEPLVRQILEATPTAQNWEAYVAILKDGAQMAALRRLGAQLQDAKDMEQCRKLLASAEGMLTARPGRKASTYALAQQPLEIQRAVHDYDCVGKNGAKYLREWEVDNVAENYKKITERTCKFGGACSHGAALLGKIYDGSYSYKPCEHVKCCSKCDKLASCKSACPKLKDKIQKLKADKKAAAQQEKLAKEEKERPDIEQITRLWARFGEARAAAGKSVKQIMDAADKYYTPNDDKQYRNLETGLEKITPSTHLPYSYNFFVTDARRLVAIADCLDCSLDYLFCRTDEPRANWVEHDASAPVTAAVWSIGKPPMSGAYVVKLAWGEDPDDIIQTFLDYDSYNDVWSFEFGEPLDTSVAKVIGWIQLPEEDEE